MAQKSFLRQKYSPNICLISSAIISVTQDFVGNCKLMLETKIYSIKLSNFIEFSCVAEANKSTSWKLINEQQSLEMFPLFPETEKLL